MSTKQDILRNGGASNQQALVKRLNPSSFKNKRVTIPGGQNMMEEIDKDSLERAIYNWLRHCRFFDSVEISFCSDYGARRTQTSKIADFPADPNGHGVWATHPERKRYLAGRLADAILRGPLVAIRADLQGMWLIRDENDDFSPESEDWEPYIEFVPKRSAKGEYSQY